MLTHPFALDNVEEQKTIRHQHPADIVQDHLVIRLMLEVAEGIAHEHDAVERCVPGLEPAGIAFVKGDLQMLGLRPFPRQTDEVAGAVDAGDLSEPAPGKFHGVTALSAAEIEHFVV